MCSLADVKISCTDCSSRASSNEQYVAEVERITRTNLVANFVLFLMEIFAGIFGSSQAVVADAVHTLSDSLTDAAILFGARLWTRPPDVGHPYGHWRIESLVTISIGILLAATALLLGYRALITLSSPSRIPPGKIALAAPLIIIFAQEMMYRWTISAGRRINSPALMASAWHHRSDGLNSIPAALAVAGAIFIPGGSFLDGAGAVVIAAIILHATWRIIRPAFEKLIDTAAPKETIDRIEQLALGISGVREVHSIRTRQIGPGLEVDLHIRVDGALTVEEGHEISREVRMRLIEEGPSVIDALIHLEPENDGKSQELISDQI